MMFPLHRLYGLFLSKTMYVRWTNVWHSNQDEKKMNKKKLTLSPANFTLFIFFIINVIIIHTIGHLQIKNQKVM